MPIQQLIARGNQIRYQTRTERTATKEYMHQSVSNLNQEQKYSCIFASVLEPRKPSGLLKVVRELRWSWIFYMPSNT